MSEQLSTDPEPEPEPQPVTLEGPAYTEEQLSEAAVINRLSNVSSRLLESDHASGRPTERYIENERGERLHRSIAEGAWRYSMFLKIPDSHANERITWQLGQQTFRHRNDDLSAAEALAQVERAFAWDIEAQQEAEAPRTTIRIRARSTLGRLAAAIAGRPAMP